MSDNFGAATAALLENYGQRVPHSGAMGHRIVEASPGRALLCQPWKPVLLGDAERGLIHTSVQLTLVDATFGVAVFCALGVQESIATLDLRMDYYRPAVAGHDIYAEALVQRVSRQIVFVQGRLWQEDGECDTAVARASFMRAANARSVLGQESAP